MRGGLWERGTVGEDSMRGGLGEDSMRGGLWERTP